MLQLRGRNRRGELGRLVVISCLVALVLAAVVVGAAAPAGGASAGAASDKATFADFVQPAWVKTAGGDAGQRDGLNDVAVTGTGVVWACGTVQTTAGGLDASLVRIAGSRMYRYSWDSKTHGSDAQTALALSGGSVFTAGGSTYTSGDDSTDVIRVMKWSSLGKMLWTRTYDGSVEGSDHTWDVVADAWGNSTVSASSARSDGGTDGVIVSWTPAGRLHWLHRIAAGTNLLVNLRDMAVDKDGNVYVVGEKGVTTSKRAALVVKYSRSGKELWRSVYRGIDRDEAHAMAVTLRPAGGVFVAGWESHAGYSDDPMLLRYSANGRRWRCDASPYDTAQGLLSDVAVASNGRVAAVGYDGGAYPKAWLFSTTGSLLRSWLTADQGDEEPWLKGVGADGSGNIYWAGHVVAAGAHGESLVAARRSTTLARGDWNGLWTNGADYTFVEACAVHGSALYVVGRYAPAGQDSDQFVLKFRP